jgi:tetratricopeptide (TPR) repeat protein
MGALQSPTLSEEELNKPLQVIERTAMLAGADLEPGTYTLTATYLNRETGETHPLAHPPASINLDASVAPKPAPELDLVTQLRVASQNIGAGLEGLEPIFVLTNRINQYDATQDYVKQADLALSFRLQREKNLSWIYTLSMARVLQQDVRGSIEALKEAIDLQPDNPYHYAYVAFVYLYDWQPRRAQPLLDRAIKLDPDVPEFHALDGVAALMQGNLVRAWKKLKVI